MQKVVEGPWCTLRLVSPPGVFCRAQPDKFLPMAMGRAVVTPVPVASGEGRTRAGKCGSSDFS